MKKSRKMSKINYELKKLKSIMEDIDLRKDFLSFAESQLHHKFGMHEIIDFFLSPSEINKKEERLIIGAYLLLDYAIYQFTEKEHLTITILSQEDSCGRKARKMDKRGRRDFNRVS